MRLSEFDLAWYKQWAIEHTSAEEWSRPGLTNGLGSLQVGGDPSSIRHLLFPPLSGAEESTGWLTLNGQFLASSRIPVKVAWCPWEISRECAYDGWEIRTRVCMPTNRQGALLEIAVTNTSTATEELELGLRLSGRCVNRPVGNWFWGVPTVATSIADLLGNAGLDPLIEPLDDGLVFAERASGSDTNNRAYNAQSLSPKPHHWYRNGDAGYRFTVDAGSSVCVFLGIGMSNQPDAREIAAAILADPDREFEAARQSWLELWQSAFSSAGPLSGQLADLDLPEELMPVATSALLSALQSRRTHRAANGKVNYNISTPRRVETCFYPNDWALAARALVQMDPEPALRQLKMAVAADVRRFNQINFITGQGGDANHEGWPYTIDIFNVFYAAWWYWQSMGADPAMLSDLKFQSPKGELSLLELLEDHAFDWRHRMDHATGLTDYGAKELLLECVTSYEHIVAGLNAGAVWMLRKLAQAYQLIGRVDDSRLMVREADHLRDSLLRHLYVEGCGWFRCRLPDGRSREVRHCWDTGMVLMCIGDELPEAVCAEIVQFFRKELQTPGWIRALSPHDADAAVSGTRADHQFNGAFGAWPALVALGLLNIGQIQLVGEWLSGIARTARQGPFGQAYYDEAVVAAVHGGAVKVTDEVPQCCHWSNLSGAMFYAVMEEWKRLATTSAQSS